MNEKVMCIRRINVPGILLGEKKSLYIRETNFKEMINNIESIFCDRKDAETDESLKQLIPYVLVTRDNSLLSYKRKGTEERLHELWSVGIGGHIEEHDSRDDNFSTIISGAQREIIEELGLSAKPILEFLGTINEEIHPVGRVHLGIVFRLTINDSAPLIFSEELETHRWQKTDRLESGELKLELWSEMALNLFSSVKF